MSHTFRFEGKGATGGTVMLDGEDISDGVRGLTLEAAVGEVTRVTLDIPVVVTSEAADNVEVFMPDQTRDLLIKLGWTPPSEGT